MKFSHIASALAASALLVTPLAAQAGTRASGSTIYPAATYSANRASTKVDDENGLTPAAWVIVLMVGGGAAYALSQILDNTSNGSN